jgi:nucleotide-binding universal stress UspA family protein
MNLTISRILVPVDFSAYSERAREYAIELAGRFGASLHLLHVVEDPIATGVWGGETVIPNLTELREELVDGAERQLVTYRDAAARAGVSVVSTVQVGLPAITIVEHAKSLGVDLIVMGTHGRTGMAHLLMGSVAERVLRHAPCPVLTIREAARREQAGAAEVHAMVGARC